MSIASIIDAPPTSTPPHPEFSATDEAQMLQDLENTDESHVSASEMGMPRQVIFHTHPDETVAEDASGEPAAETSASLRDDVASEEAVPVQETAAVQETATSRATEDNHSFYSATPAFDYASQNSTLPVDNLTISATGTCYVPSSIRPDGSIRREIRIRPGHASSVPTNTEPNIKFIPNLSASEALPSQTDIAQSSIPAPSTSNQPNESFTSHRAIRPGGFLTSRYADVPAATLTQASGFTTPFSAYAANVNSGKRRHVEEENEGPSGFQDERSAKRMRTTNSRESIGDRRTAVPQILPSPYDRYEWALINDNMRDSQDQSMVSEPEETPERSIVGQDIVDREPVIKTEPVDDAPSKSNVIPPAPQPPLTPAQSNSPSVRQPPTASIATQRPTLHAPVSAPEHINLFDLCIPRCGNRRPTQVELNKIREIEIKTALILSGHKEKVDILGQLPPWMRVNISRKQRQLINDLVRRIKAAKAGQHSYADVRSFNAIPSGSTPAPTRATAVPVTQTYQQTSVMAAPTPPQAQLLAPQQARQPYGLDPLKYENTFGPALVYSALEQVNNMLGAFGVNARCYPSGMDSITLKNQSIEPPPPPTGCMLLSLENMPYVKLAGPALVNHALHQVNDMTSSLWPGQFVLHGKDMLLLQL
ncbi:hypothetical protein J4E90_006576 [Alternaria incomplexa]|uniref:uncharacterized protein n=1 Tax=Alternaria incomplexa TaxID=1187928 RepID=UPI00221FD43F|nr:uncharacterized protein J4E90_006576 [Alternaria incomplexa]KAI4911759.1 hypothetical protein J4E90_006576 [Alternaria incomplexa]